MLSVMNRSRTFAVVASLAVLLSGCGGGADTTAVAPDTVTVEVPTTVTPSTNAEDAKAEEEKPEKEKPEKSSPPSKPPRSTTAKPTTAPPERPRKAPRSRVTRVIDGDTVELRNGDGVRLLGIDTPEEGECGYDAATQHMERLVLGRSVRLVEATEDTDRYDRLLRYVIAAGVDAGLRQIQSGQAIARYDSRDGYGPHPREDRYIAVDRKTPNAHRCVAPTPKPAPKPAPTPQPTFYFENCTEVEAAGAAPIYRGDRGYSTDLDADGDGVACET